MYYNILGYYSNDKPMAYQKLLWADIKFNNHYAKNKNKREKEA